MRLVVRLAALVAWLLVGVALPLELTSSVTVRVPRAAAWLPPRLATGTPVYASASLSPLVFTSTSVATLEAPEATATVGMSGSARPCLTCTVSPETTIPALTGEPTASPVPLTPTPTELLPTPLPTPTPRLATIDYFVANRSAIYAGDQVELSWDLHDAREAYLVYDGHEEGVVAPGSKAFTLTRTTAFTLSARTEDGAVTERLIVTVYPATVTPIPMPTPDGTARTADVPILMYHYISAPPPDADIYRLDLSVTPQNFEAQLAWLRSQGYTTITLGDLVYHLTLGRPLPDKPVVLTFDDGYRDNYENAFPLLKKYGCVGTFFLVTRPIDVGDPNYMTWDMVVEMHRAGMSMQPHGYRHYDLKGKSLDLLVYEIVGAKEAIEERTGESVRFFSYPAGSYDQRTIDVLQSAHFWAAVTTIQGRQQSSAAPFELRRLRIRSTTTLDDLSRLLNLTD
jgi:peptidoglycan/xylan/chitin deacetylase (PgdA/CDA1 family)